jgi:hypothetical protein
MLYGLLILFQKRRKGRIKENDEGDEFNYDIFDVF